MSDTKKGDKNPMYGKHLSPETRQKMSDAKKGEKNPWYGKTFTDEHRRHLSEAQKGKHKHRVSPQARRKISEALTGRYVSPETRSKMSESAKRRWHKRKT
jgi:hypothetical protein